MTFCLVHGAFHGAWCWDLLVEELAGRGHRSVAVDLPCEDVSAGTARYAEIVAGAIDEAGATDGVVLVGHSVGGLTIPVVAGLRPVRHLVFLCAFVPQPGRSFFDWSDEEADLYPTGSAPDIWPVSDPDGLMRWPPERAVRALYPDCPPETARWAAQRLRRQALTPHKEPCPLDRWPDVEASTIGCADDVAVSPSWIRRVAKERLGAASYDLPGGHSPFLSRPAALADLLVEIAAGS